MIDAGKELADVALENVAVASQIMLEPVHSRMGALAPAAGIGVLDESALEERLDDIAQGVMDHPVAVGRGADQPLLGLVDVERPVGTWAICLLDEFALEPQQLPFQLEVELR